MIGFLMMVLLGVTLFGLLIAGSIGLIILIIYFIKELNN